MKVGGRRLRRGAELVFSESRWDGRRSVKFAEGSSPTVKVWLLIVPAGESWTMLLELKTRVPRLPANHEIAAWWEIPRPLAEKAGLKWRGRFDWDWAANVGFSPGYTPAERRKLVDVYMADFKAIFGYYPRTVGSWFIDEVTLGYLAERYGIVASCNCSNCSRLRDQREGMRE